MVSTRERASRGLLAWTVVSRAVVAGVHGLEHVQRLARAALSDDDPVGAHSQGVAEQVPDRDLALALGVRRARLERDHMALAELELLGVFDRDYAFVRRDERREDVEQRGFAGARARLIPGCSPYPRRRPAVTRPRGASMSRTQTRSSSV